MNNFTHLVYIPFRGVGVKNGDDEWFRERIEIFKQYTLKSLLNQTNQNFVLWLSFRPEDTNSKLVNQLQLEIGKAKIVFFSTFNGLMYHDDKNQQQNFTLLARLWDSLKYLKDYINSGYILMTRLDSDDMLHKDAVEEIQWEWEKADKNTKALVFLRGLVYNTETKELAEWRPRTNPPFHTIIFPKDIFFDAKKHLEYYGDWQSHEDTILVWPFIKLSDYKYCVTVHPKGHISTNWSHSFRGKPMDKQLLKDFGI